MRESKAYVYTHGPWTLPGRPRPNQGRPRLRTTGVVMDNFQEDYVHPGVTLADPRNVRGETRLLCMNHSRYSNHRRPTCSQRQETESLVLSPDFQPFRRVHISWRLIGGFGDHG